MKEKRHEHGSVGLGERKKEGSSLMIARMKYFLLPLLSCLLLLSSLVCYADSNAALSNAADAPVARLVDTGAISIKGSSDSGLSAGVSVLTDELGKETIAFVSAMDSSRFTPLRNIFSAGYTRKVYWLRIVLRHNEKTPARWLLEVGPGYLDDVRLYTADATTLTGFREHKSGDLLPFAARELPHRLMLFPISLPPGHVDDIVYLRLQSTSTLMAHMTLWQPRDFAVATQVEYLGLGLVLGVLLLMLLFSTVFWFLLRERYLLLFVGLIVSMLIAVLGINGLSERCCFLRIRHWPIYLRRLASVCWCFLASGSLSTF